MLFMILAALSYPVRAWLLLEAESLGMAQAMVTSDTGFS